jgi:hypothetical protein
MPTRKWIANQITGLAAVLTMWATTGSWDVEETVALIGLLSQAGVTYLIPNDPGTAGVKGQEGQP